MRKTTIVQFLVDRNHLIAQPDLLVVHFVVARAGADHRAEIGIELDLVIRLLDRLAQRSTDVEAVVERNDRARFGHEPVNAAEPPLGHREISLLVTGDHHFRRDFSSGGRFSTSHRPTLPRRSSDRQKGMSVAEYGKWGFLMLSFALPRVVKPMKNIHEAARSGAKIFSFPTRLFV